MAKTIQMKVTQDQDAEGNPALSFWDEHQQLGRPCLLVSMAYNVNEAGEISGLTIYDQKSVSG